MSTKESVEVFNIDLSHPRLYGEFIVDYERAKNDVDFQKELVYNNGRRLDPELNMDRKRKMIQHFEEDDSFPIVEFSDGLRFKFHFGLDSNVDLIDPSLEREFELNNVEIKIDDAVGQLTIREVERIYWDTLHAYVRNQKRAKRTNS